MIDSVYDTEIVATHIRGVVDRRYLVGVRASVPNESYLVPNLAKFDYVIAKHLDRDNDHRSRYCAGWIISDPRQDWLKLWTERYKVCASFMAH